MFYSKIPWIEVESLNFNHILIDLKETVMEHRGKMIKNHGIV